MTNALTARARLTRPDELRQAPQLRTVHAKSPVDQLHYHLLLGILVLCLLFHYGIARLLWRCFHPLAPRRSESVYAEARSVAGSVLPYVLMH
ncbi:MAG: hypothetical protein AAGF32_09315 [Pseudomonadota bacterium]